jgi:hypothetical protein
MRWARLCGRLARLAWFVAGVIEYREFMPIMVDLIHAAQARDEAAWQAEMDAMDAEFI